LQQQQRQKQQQEVAASGDPELPRPKNEGHLFLARSGLLNVAGDRPQRSLNEPWTVRGGSFTMAIECKMAVSNVKLTKNGNNIITGNKVYSKPMQLMNPITSTLVVEFSQNGGAQSEEKWRLNGLVKGVPRA